MLTLLLARPVNFVNAQRNEWSWILCSCGFHHYHRLALWVSWNVLEKWSQQSITQLPGKLSSYSVFTHFSSTYSFFWQGMPQPDLFNLNWEFWLGNHLFIPSFFICCLHFVKILSSVFLIFVLFYSLLEESLWIWWPPLECFSSTVILSESSPSFNTAEMQPFHWRVGRDLRSLLVHTLKFFMNFVYILYVPWDHMINGIP